MRLVEAFVTAVMAQRSRWVLWAPVAMAVGIGAYFHLPVEPAGSVGFALFAAAVLSGVALRRRQEVLLFLWLPVFLVILGFVAAQARAWRVEAPMLRKKTPPIVLMGRVMEAEVVGKGVRVMLDRLQVEGEVGQEMPVRVRLRLKAADPARPRAGDMLRVRAILLPLSLPVVPGAFDFRRHGYFQRMGATGFAIADAEVVSGGEAGFFFESLRRQIRDRIYARPGEDRDVKALAVAFLVGDAGEISPADWRAARESGIAHLIAISGSHFMMIVGGVFFTLRALMALSPRLALRWPIKKIAAGAGIVAAIFYMLLIGAPLPAQRAVVMSAAVMLALILDRDPFSLRLAALAAFLILLVEPETLVGASFQLSFAAVIGMIAFFDATRGWWSAQYRAAGHGQRAGLFMLGLLLTSIVAGLCTAPYALYHFLRVALPGGLAANMIAVPVSSFITFPMGLLACLLMPVGLDALPLWVMEKSIVLIMEVARFVAAWPVAGFAVSAWPVAVLGVVTLGAVWVCIWEGRLRWLGLVPVCLAPVFASLQPRPDILIGGQFRLLAAVRDTASPRLLFSPGRAERFVRTAWQDREGRGLQPGVWPEEPGAPGPVSCDPAVCTYQAHGVRVVFVRDDAAATPAQCASADIVVTPRAKRPDGACAARVIDKWALYYGGVHAVFLSEGARPRIETVGAWQGLRPWSRKRFNRPPV